MSRRGRPPSFDRNVALERAMEVFWEKGYEGAQLVDLTAAMEINPPSFYAAFGSKKAAFCEAVDLYISTVGSKSAQALNSAPTARDGLRAMLTVTIDVATSTEAGGCLLVLGVVNNLPENDEVWSHLKAKRSETLALIRARLERGITDKDLPPHTDVKALASHFLGLTQTISFQARDGASRAALKRLIEPGMAALPSIEQESAHTR
ncbi:TetR/AcrR family transcriptional regulator [Serratia ficaria]|uniref:TetR/AcrR family transcriptional regulator n=1 Tax=Serratia ficaria TaxID=61651 RepID=UPI0021790B55|nr:TetR/AcrR family transcriptional regulator [Serratia ficaria]CAI1033939.1 Bacterial regulatory proteins, tetR family [Serratia ficaria]CAI1223681.1 Bacterial regulatory proteins, tetR family [Serratia ficaria]CAI2025061.1 Bacterial regulatory proteins, tetR family [Serratia ficaria]CAI2429477.1 Bacterial regulatory proteins, tetR family [Serratia ficaria]CAI2495290.1 Bacterial regulatory proteins, tetR family [Serratia ficaria]